MEQRINIKQLKSFRDDSQRKLDKLLDMESYEYDYRNDNLQIKRKIMDLYEEVIGFEKLILDERLYQAKKLMK